MKKKKAIPLVFFNASVVLAGFKSPKGGSAKILSLIKNKKMSGIISETVFDEIVRNSHKIGFKKEAVEKLTENIFSFICKVPEQKNVNVYQKKVIDPGDAHVLASCYEIKADFLATLDKKHLLILKNKLTGLKIVSPGELIEKLSLSVQNGC